MSDNIKKVYQAFLKAGFSSNQAKALTAEVGRENAYQSKYIFGHHTDMANSADNLGFFSWQGERKKNLLNKLQQKGLYNNGRIKEGQEALDTMAEFAKEEMQNIGSYKKTREGFLNNPNISQKDAAELLGRNYLRWDMDGKYIKNVNEHKKRRDKFYSQISGEPYTESSEESYTESQLPEYVNFADVGELPSSQGIVFGEEEVKTEEKKPEGVKAADKLNELSFVEELKNLYESEPIQEQQQVYTEVLPTVQVTPLEYTPIQLQKGGIIKDNRGQWEHPGEITQISSPNITMKNVPYPVFAIADTGERKLMQPEQDYYFKGAKTVTEYPILQVGGQIVEVDRGDGKIENINTDSEEYRKLYEEGRVLGREGDTLVAPQELNGVTITAFRKNKQQEPQFKVDEQELQQRLDNPYNFEAKKDATSVTKEEILPEVKKGQNLPNIKEVKELASTYKTEEELLEQETEKLLKRRQELFDNRYNDLNPEEELDETLDINKLKTKDDILKVQKRLDELGYNLNPKGSFENDGIDGKLGNVTKKAIDTYNQTKAKNIYSSYKEGEGLLGKCTEKQCSEYAQNEIFRNFKPSVNREIWNEKTGLYGDAWTIGKHIEQAGGKKVEKVQPGDAVTMYTGGASSYLGEAKKHGTDATHIGIVDKVNPDGSYYILHNVHEGSRGSYEGREYRDLIKDGKIVSGSLGRSFEIRGSYRPNYDAVKDYEKKSKVREDVALTIHPKKLEELQALNKSYTGANIQKNVNELMQPLNNINNKKVMTQKHGITEEEYQSIAKLSLGILAQESGFGTSDKLLPKEIAAKTLETVGLRGEASEGAGQIKYKTNYGDSDLTEFGINESNFDESSKTPLVVADRIATYYRQLIKKGETKENALYKAVEKYNRGSNTKYTDSKDSDYVNKVVNFSELFLVQDKKGKAYNTTTDKLLLEKQVAKKKVAK